MTRYGKTSTGRQRYRCAGCRTSRVAAIDTSAKDFALFLSFLFSRQRQRDLPGAGRTFRRRTARFWQLWPTPEVVDEVHRVIYVDGIHLGRSAVILIASTDTHVVGWYLARSEHSQAWGALLARIAPPQVVVTDGGSGFAKARRAHWPTTKVQRCTFHAFSQVRRQTTTRPRTQAGVELYGLAKALLHVRDNTGAAAWLAAYTQWRATWEAFLAERTRLATGQVVLTHQRLVTARSALDTLIRTKTLFTYVDPANFPVDAYLHMPLPATNNRIEGGINTQLRALLRDHRGMSLDRRIKAIMWWCYMHTEYPASPARILRTMPTDTQIQAYYRAAASRGEHARDIGLPGIGTAAVWNELHHSTSYITTWD
ncbi:IS1249 family transposase [Flaviflexus salsibiostraticola]|uniref:IS1249 family transposase n=2 Tax=Flaviflexus salsibiostraticola TaxID=1282737 RepID=A0A3Q8WV25_9ACTO|nr:IS1249 family transposase [Flaviflexus salsibiostraticola]AZN29998.1 IS1249 family transposase [Flaviflexus salsibiostraticola]AZN30068.1 IS1249 family transposase [Flaviflexus salsibiostraticola]